MSWSRITNGVRVSFESRRRDYGALSRTVAETFAASVRAGFPAATVEVLATETGAAIWARVFAEDVAALEGGPAHRRAIAQLFALAHRLYESTPWLESNRPQPKETPPT
jgi:hypothetical protein